MAHMQTVIGYFRDVSQIVLDETVTDEAIRPTIYEQVPVDTLQTALDEVESFFIAGRKRTHLDFFDKRYSYFRRFTRPS